MSTLDVFVNGLRQIGFDYVLHTNFTADLTIMEEGHELLKRVKEGGTLPMFTSCSPGWINFCETFYPDLLDHLSTCKSPQQMFGALVKTYWAEKMNINPAKIFSVSIMPCVAKKFEATRPEMRDSGYQDVDIVLTTREIGRLFRQSGIDFSKLPPSNFDSWMGAYTGAAVIFGASGGVMEAALRTVYEVVTGKTLDVISSTRGFDGIKEATVDLNGLEVKVTVTALQCRKLMDQAGPGVSLSLIEVMACPGGCVAAATTHHQAQSEALSVLMPFMLRTKGCLEKIPRTRKSRYCIEFLGEPLGHKSMNFCTLIITPRTKIAYKQSLKTAPEFDSGSFGDKWGRSFFVTYMVVGFSNVSTRV